MNQPWKVIVVLLGIFVAGGVTGGFVTARVCKNKNDRPVPEEWAPRTLRMLVERLAITPEQQEQIRPVVRSHMEDLNRVRNHSLSQTQNVVESMQSEISALLTEEQRVKYAQMNRQLRAAREKKEKDERMKRLNLSKSFGEKEAPKEPEGEKPAEKPPGN